MLASGGSGEGDRGECGRERMGCEGEEGGEKGRLGELEKALRG